MNFVSDYVDRDLRAKAAVVKNGAFVFRFPPGAGLQYDRWDEFAVR